MVIALFYPTFFRSTLKTSVYARAQYTYNPVTHAIKRIDTFKRKIEALEMGPDGYLLMGQNESRKVVIYDPLAQRMVHGIDDDHHPEHRGWYRSSRIIDTINVSPYNDPEGIAWNVCNP